MSVFVLAPLLFLAAIGAIVVLAVVMAAWSARHDDRIIEARQDAMKERELQDMIERHRQETQ